MKNKTIKEFHDRLSWNTKLYTLLAIVVALVARFSNAMNTNFALTMIIGLLVVLFVESFAVVSVKHPLIWRYVRWGVLLAILAIVLLGFQQ